MGELRSIPTIGYPVYVAKLERGFIGQAGCHTRAYETLDQLITDVRLYLKDPKRVISQMEGDTPQPVPTSMDEVALPRDMETNPV